MEVPLRRRRCHDLRLLLQIREPAEGAILAKVLPVDFAATGVDGPEFRALPLLLELDVPEEGLQLPDGVGLGHVEVFKCFEKEMLVLRASHGSRGETSIGVSRVRS